MPTPRKPKAAKTRQLNSSSEDDSDVANQFYAHNEKTPNKAPKKMEPPAYKTRSGRKVISKFDKMKLAEAEEEETSNSSDSDLSEGEKPSALYEDDKAIESNMFGFNTPGRKKSMMSKASDSVTKTPKDVLKTPKSESKLKVGVTPRATRSRIKNKISREAARQKYADTDSGSEFQPSESSEDSSSSSEDPVPLDDLQEEEDEEEDGEEKEKNVEKEKAPLPQRVSTRIRKPRCNDTNFIYTSDEYFERRNAKSATSDHNLNKLKNPRLQQDQLMALLKDVNPRHQEALKDLDAENQAMFARWLFAMSQGFNVLCYGVGSKQTLLNAFHVKHLSTCSTLVVNGYFPGLTLKEILDSLAGDVLKIKTIPGQPHEVVDSIASKLRSTREPDVFLVIHNLDGKALRTEKTQSVLSALAALPKIHLIASIDHINSPLLWDQNKLSQLNFIWEDATSFLPYFHETSFESSLMVQRSGTIALAALRNVFQSLNVNARKVFRLLMENQLKNGGKSYQGMLFSELYRACRNAFIVSSDLALRTQLTEFFDHKLVKHKKDTDHLSIPVDPAVLRQFNDEISMET